MPRARNYVPLPKQVKSLAEMGYTGIQISRILDANHNTVMGIAANNGITLYGKRGRPTVPNPVRTRPRTGPAGSAFYHSKDAVYQFNRRLII